MYTLHQDGTGDLWVFKELMAVDCMNPSNIERHFDSLRNTVVLGSAMSSVQFSFGLSEAMATTETIEEMIEHLQLMDLLDILKD